MYLCGGAVSPDDSEVAISASVSIEADDYVSVQTLSWRLDTHEFIKSFVNDTTSNCGAPFWSPDGTLFSLTRSQTVEFWTDETTPYTHLTDLYDEHYAAGREREYAALRLRCAGINPGLLRRRQSRPPAREHVAFNAKTP